MVQVVLLLSLGIALWNAILLILATIIDYFLCLLSIAHDYPCHNWVVYAGDPPSPDSGVQGRHIPFPVPSRRYFVFLVISSYVSGFVFTAEMSGHNVLSIHKLGRLSLFVIPAGTFVGTATHAILLQRSKLLQRLIWHERPLEMTPVQNNA
jgi:hypothetical protein